MAKKEKSKSPPVAPEDVVPAPFGGLRARVRPWLPLAALLVFGAFMRFNMVLWSPLIFPDSLQYMHLAREIRSGEFFEEQYDLDGGFIKSRRLPPFYSLLLSPFADTQADLETVGHLVSIFLSLYTFIPLYLLARAAFSRREAFLAGVLFAFNSHANKFSSPILTESTFTALYVTVAWLSLLGLRRKSWPLLAGAGVFSALTYMTRDVGITAAAVVAVGVVVRFWLVDHLPARRVAFMLAAVIGAFLVVAAPYFVHIRARTGQWGLTVQMSNTSITEQVQLYGGDRFDRDRVSVTEKRERLVGGRPAEGPAGLILVAPQLAAKLVRNAWGYFRELLAKAQSLPVLLLFVGLLAVGSDFRRGLGRSRLFDQLWPAVWVFQLLFLYALITPYMVDIRYMAPLLPLLFILTGRAATMIADRAEAGASGSPGKLGPALAAVALCALFILGYAWLTDGEAYARVQLLLGKSLAPLRKIFTALGVTPFLSALLLALPPVGPIGAILSRSAMSRRLGGAVLFGVGVAMMFVIAFADGRISDTALAAFVAGPGLALWLGAMPSPRLRPALLYSSLLGGLIFFSAPDTIYQWNWFSSKELNSKYASGYKEAAAEIKSLGLVPSGSLICARKPFIAYYLDGRWYLDEEGQPIPKRDARLSELVREHKIDFLVLDSFTTKNLRPALTERALAIEPMPGATLVYSRYFPQYERLITLYDCRRDEPEPPRRLAAAEYFRAAEKLLEQRQYPFALRELQRGLELDPQNANAWFAVVRIFGIYFESTSRADVSHLALAPRVLPALLNAAENYYRLKPSDERARMTYAQVKKMYEEEKKILDGARPQLVGSDD